MNGPHERMSSSQLLTQLQAAALALGFRLDAWQRRAVESLYRDTTARPPARHTVLTRRPRFARAQFTLRLTLSLTPHAMVSPSRDHPSIALIHPAIRVHVSSLMQEYRPWFSIASIETILDSGSSPT